MPWWPFSKSKSSPEIAYGVQHEQNHSNVTFDNAMCISAFWASTRILTESVSAMPLKAYRISDDVKQEVIDYPLWNLINYKPNRYQTRTEFFEQIMLNLVTSGNAYVEISRDRLGNIFSLLPINSSEMSVEILGDGSITYTRQLKHGKHAYSENSIWHIRLFGNGLIGLSPLAHASSALSTASSIDSRVSTLAKNGGKMSGILSFDRQLKPEQRELLKKKLQAESTSDSLMVLEMDMKYQSVSLSPSDLQLLENRRFQVEDIARFMGVPSILINDTKSSTTWGSGISEIKQGFYQFHLKPYLERIESSLKRNLMPESDWSQYEIEFDFDSILRADAKTRTEAYATAINSGQMTPNESRAKQGLPPKENGDELFVNGALISINNSRNEDEEN